MATVTYLGALNAGGTSNNLPWITASFAVPADALIVVCVGAGSTVTTAPTGESVVSSGGLTFTDSGVLAVSTAVFKRLKFWVSNTLSGSSPGSQTFTYNASVSGTTQGSTIGVWAITGMSRTGLTSVRQTAKVDNLVSGVAGTATFPGACLTTNPMLYAFVGEDGGVTYPISDTTGWTANLNSTFTKPDQRVSLNMRSSGFTGTSVTSSSTNTRRCMAVIEFDSSSSGPRRRYVITS